jgi:predicted nucleotidyltransferase
MTKTRDQALDVVRRFRQAIEPLYGDRLKAVYLYGSYARNEADEDSDIDIAVLLADLVNRHDEIRRLSTIRARFSLEEGCILMPFSLSEGELRTTPDAIFRSIAREGLAA